MYSTFEIRFMVAPSKVNKEGLAPLQVSLIVNGERTYIQLPRKVKPADFDASRQKCKDDADANEYINVVKARLMQIQTQLTAMGQPVSAQKVKSIYRGEAIAKVWGILELFDKHNDEFERLVGRTVVADTYERYLITRRYLAQYIRKAKDAKELSKIIRPYFVQQYPFRVFISAPQYSSYAQKEVESQAIEHATLSVELGYNTETREQEILSVDSNGELKKIYVSERPCGLVGVTIYYYDQKAKAKFRKFTDERLDGIKIYRDGLIATPFAEYVAHRDEQKDLLGIDKRRWSGFFERLSTRDLLGWVDISGE